MRRGFIHLVPLIVIAVVGFVAAVGTIGKMRSVDNASVLSSSDANKQSGKGSSNSNKDNNSEKGQENKGQGSTNSQSKSDSFSQRPASAQPQNKNETKSQGSDKKVKKEVETDLSLADEEENEAEDEDELKSATPSGRKIRTNFPITVNPVTNEKIVTTPSGVKVVVLPEVAIQNMIKAGFPVVLPEPSPSSSPSPGEGTPSATVEASPSVEVEEGEVTLSEVNGQLVYEIPAVKKQKFLAVVPVDVQITGLVSAESGDILEIKQSLFDRILDFLSF